MKKKNFYLLFALSMLLSATIWAQAPGTRYGSAIYFVSSVDTANSAALVSFEFKLEVDASAVVTTSGGSVLLSSITTFPSTLPGAVAVNFGAGSGTSNLDAMVDTIIDDVAYITVVEPDRPYDLDLVTSDVLVKLLIFTRTSLAGVGLSGDQRPAPAFPDNRNGFFILETIIPEATFSILQGYESPVSDVGNFTRIASGNPNASILIDATVDESVTLDSYEISMNTQSGLISGLTKLEEAGITNLTINSGTGLITFSTVGAFPGRYPLQVFADDDRGGKASNDFIVEIIPPCSTKPTFVAVGNVTPTGGTSDPVPTYDVPLGNTIVLNVEVAADDPNAADVLVQTSTLPMGATFEEDNTNPNNYIFTWTPPVDAPNVNLSVVATDIDVNGDKICESASLIFKIRPLNEPCRFNTVFTSNIDQASPLPTGQNPDEYCANSSTGIDLSAIPQFNTTYAYSWEYVDADNALPNVSIPASTFEVNDLVPPVDYEIIRVTIDDRNVGACDTVIDYIIPFGCPPSPCSASIMVNNCSPYGDPNTFYRGYSTGMELIADAGTATGPFTYLWSTGDTTDRINVVPTTGTSYTVTITDASGNACTETQFIDHVDLECCGTNKCEPIVKSNWGGNNNNQNTNPNKVTICHYPPGNPSNVQTITISQNALAAHQANHGCVISMGACAPDPCERLKYKKRCKIKLCKTSGWCAPKTICVKAKWADWLLACGNYELGPCNNTNKMGDDETVVWDMVNTIKVTPNPSTGRFNLAYDLMHEADVTITVVDYMGRVVYNQNGHDAEGAYEEIIDLEGKPAGLYILTISAFDETWTEKLQIVK